jgi:hypothetical protein
VRPPPTTGVPPSFRTSDPLGSVPEGEEFMAAKQQKYSPEFREEAARTVVDGLRLLPRWAATWG